MSRLSNYKDGTMGKKRKSRPATATVGGRNLKERFTKFNQEQMNQEIYEDTEAGGMIEEESKEQNEHNPNYCVTELLNENSVNEKQDNQGQLNI